MSDGDLAYFSLELADSTEGLELPCDRARPAVRAPVYARVSLPLERRVSGSVRRVLTNRSPQAWSLAATAVFFGKIANAKSFVVGVAPQAGRGGAGRHPPHPPGPLLPPPPPPP